MSWAEEMGEEQMNRTDVLRASPPMFDSRVLDSLSRVHPVVPSRGSVGASGDLAPLAHLALVLIGEGQAAVARHVFNDELRTPVVRHALGDSAGVIGAALLAAAD